MIGETIFKLLPTGESRDYRLLEFQRTTGIRVSSNELRGSFKDVQHEASTIASFSGSRYCDAFTCLDCSGSNDSYMVLNSVWEQATPLQADRCFGNICLACLEKRLGRPLTLDDFSPAPINSGIRWAWQRASTH